MRNKNAVNNELYSIGRVDGTNGDLALAVSDNYLRMTPDEAERLGQALIAVARWRLADVHRLITGESLT